MDAIDPRVDLAALPAGCSARVIVGTVHPEYEDPLPVIATPAGQVITRWRLTEEERAAIANGADLFVTLLADPRKPLISPIYVTAGPAPWRGLEERLA